jgi:antitoxin component YwqK of YwqJK toxin-antitoxin module
MYRKSLTKYILLFSLVLFRLLSVSQDNRINQFDSNGKRSGKWLIYVDKNWKEVKDTNVASFKLYELFLNGKANYHLIGKRKHEGKLESSIDTINKLLDGDFKWYDKQGLLTDWYIFNKGDIVMHKYFSKNGDIKEYSDYNITYDNEPYSFGMYLNNYRRDQQNTYTFFIYRNGNRDWAFYEWDVNDSKITKKEK